MASIDAVYANIDSVPLKPGFLCKLKEGEASARRSYWLATIDTNAPLDFDPEANLRQPFKPELYGLFLKLEFQKLIDKYQLSPACVAEELPTYTAEAEILETAERAEACLALWREAAIRDRIRYTGSGGAGGGMRDRGRQLSDG